MKEIDRKVDEPDCVISEVDEHLCMLSQWVTRGNADTLMLQAMLYTLQILMSSDQSNVQGGDGSYPSIR